MRFRWWHGQCSGSRPPGVTVVTSWTLTTPPFSPLELASWSQLGSPARRVPHVLPCWGRQEFRSPPQGAKGPTPSGSQSGVLEMQHHRPQSLSGRRLQAPSMEPCVTSPLGSLAIGNGPMRPELTARESGSRQDLAATGKAATGLLSTVVQAAHCPRTPSRWEGRRG